MAALAAGRQWIQFDLGSNYALSGVKVWHYYGSADRVYNDVIVQTSTRRSLLRRQHRLQQRLG